MKSLLFRAKEQYKVAVVEGSRGPRAAGVGTVLVMDTVAVAVMCIPVRTTYTELE